MQGFAFDRQCDEALEIAKSALAEDEKLDVPLLMAALYHHTPVRNVVPRLASYLAPPVRRHERPPGKAPVADALKPILNQLAYAPHSVSPRELFAALLSSEAGRRALATRGMQPAQVEAVLEELKGDSAWRESKERQDVIQALGGYGRMLTAVVLPPTPLVDIEKPLRALIRNLCKFRRRNVLVLGQPGAGKSVLVYELARRLAAGDPSIPPQLRNMDIFELAPVFLRSGASMVGQYEERVKSLVQLLQSHARVILFVDEIHSFFQSGLHARGPFTDANETFKGVLGRGEITCIGCTTPAEYRHLIEPDEALARRFNILRLDPPSNNATRRILEARLPAMGTYYAPLRIPANLVAQAVDMTDTYLPGRCQPDKSIQLLDEACACCVTSDPPLPEVTSETLQQALEDMVGHGIVRTDQLSDAGVFDRLRASIIGQDQVLREISTAFVAGIGDWKKGDHPRGVFLFAGPTGVGKTETTVRLARILGSGETEPLIRIDGNTLQGTGRDSGPAITRLLGAPPGYVGYVRGQGGVLSRIRDLPESIVLFDELEKADPGIGEILLRVMDEGRVEDADGNLLDFRRAFLVFCTNAGCSYGSGKNIGFRDGREDEAPTPVIDAAALTRELRAAGFGEAFLGRILHRFLFQGLSRTAVRDIVASRLESLCVMSEARGLRLEWDDCVVERLTRHWQPRFGVRHLTTILRNRISEQLAVAEAQGELSGVGVIRLNVIDASAEVEAEALSGAVRRRREGDLLMIEIL